MTLKQWTSIAAALTVLTLVMGSPLVDVRHLTDASYEGDSRLLMWTLAWDARALSTGAPLFDANIFFPEPQAFRFTEHHIGIGVFALPVYALTGNAVLSYWVVWLLAFPLNGLAMSALAYRVTRSPAAAFAAGLVYAFSFFRMHHAHGHLQLLWTWGFPLIPLALERWAVRPSAGRALVASILVVLQSLAGGYLAVMVAVLSTVTILFLLPVHRPPLRPLAIATLIAVVSVSSLFWFAQPYLSLEGSAAPELAGNSADVASYLVPPENTWAGPLAARAGLAPRWIWGEQTLYSGVLALTFSAIGRCAWRRRWDSISLAVVVTGVLALLLSFGPGEGWSPFDLFARLPGMSLFRAPARFALLVVLATALLVAIAVAWLQPRLGRAAAPVLLLLAALGLSESYVIDFPAGQPAPTPIPPVYERIAALAPGAVLSLPAYRGTPDAFRQADYLLFSTAHWHPIVNGAGRQEPPQHGERMTVFARFPSQQAVDRLREVGVRYVVLHTGRASELREAVRAAETAAGVRLIGTFGDDFLYEVP
jgi:hypothetical protein